MRSAARNARHLMRQRMRSKAGRARRLHARYTLMRVMKSAAATMLVLCCLLCRAAARAATPLLAFSADALFDAPQRCACRDCRFARVCGAVTQIQHRLRLAQLRRCATVFFSAAQASAI